MFGDVAAILYFGFWRGVGRLLLYDGSKPCDNSLHSKRLPTKQIETLLNHSTFPYHV